MNIEDLVPKLIETTKKKKINWTQATDSMFVARIGGKRFQTEQGFDDDSEETFYRFSIYNSNSDSPFEGYFIDTMYADRFRGAYSDLEELYTAARRSALNLDKVISDIDNELGKLLM